MNLLALLNVEKFLVFTLVLTRISGLLIASPIFGATQAPATVRALISLALAVLIMPSQWFATLPYPGSLLVYVVVIGGELLIGLVLGLGISILLGGIQMAGDMMSRVGGLTLADVFDPTTSSQRAAVLATAGPAEHGPVPDHRRASHPAGRPAGHVSAPSRPAEAWRCSSARPAAARAPGCSRRWWKCSWS